MNKDKDLVLTLFVLYNPFIQRSENNDQNVLSRELPFTNLYKVSRQQLLD